MSVSGDIIQSIPIRENYWAKIFSTQYVLRYGLTRERLRFFLGGTHKFATEVEPGGPADSRAHIPRHPYSLWRALFHNYSILICFLSIARASVLVLPCRTSDSWIPACSTHLDRRPGTVSHELQPQLHRNDSHIERVLVGCMLSNL